MHAGGVGDEKIAGEVIVARVQADADLVAGRNAAAPAQPGADGCGIPHVASGGDVEEAIVVRHLHHGALARGRHVVWILLDEIVDLVRQQPAFLVQVAVDLRRLARDMKRAQVLACRVVPLRAGWCVPQDTKCQSRGYRPMFDAVNHRNTRRRGEPRRCLQVSEKSFSGVRL